MSDSDYEDDRAALRIHFGNRFDSDYTDSSDATSGGSDTEDEAFNALFENFKPPLIPAEILRSKSIYRPPSPEDVEINEINSSLVGNSQTLAANVPDGNAPQRRFFTQEQITIISNMAKQIVEMQYQIDECDPLSMNFLLMIERFREIVELYVDCINIGSVPDFSVHTTSATPSQSNVLQNNTNFRILASNFYAFTVAKCLKLIRQVCHPKKGIKAIINEARDLIAKIGNINQITAKIADRNLKTLSTLAAELHIGPLVDACLTNDEIFSEMNVLICSSRGGERKHNRGIECSSKGTSDEKVSKSEEKILPFGSSIDASAAANIESINNEIVSVSKREKHRNKKNKTKVMTENGTSEINNAGRNCRTISSGEVGRVVKSLKQSGETVSDSSSLTSPKDDFQSLKDEVEDDWIVQNRKSRRKNAKEAMGNNNMKKENSIIMKNKQDKVIDTIEHAQALTKTNPSNDVTVSSFVNCNLTNYRNVDEVNTSQNDQPVLKVRNRVDNAKKFKEENVSKDLNISPFVNVDLPKKLRKKKSIAVELVSERKVRSETTTDMNDTYKESALEKNLIIFEDVEKPIERNGSSDQINDSYINKNISPTVSVDLPKRRRNRKSKPKKLVLPQVMTSETVRSISDNYTPNEVAVLGGNVLEPVGNNGNINSSTDTIQKIIIDKKHIRYTIPNDYHGNTKSEINAPSHASDDLIVSSFVNLQLMNKDEVDEVEANLSQNDQNINENISKAVSADLPKKRRNRKSKPIIHIHSQAMTTKTINGNSGPWTTPDELANLEENVMEPVDDNGAINSCTGTIKKIIIDKKQNARDTKTNDVLDCHGNTEWEINAPSYASDDVIVSPFVNRQLTNDQNVDEMNISQNDHQPVLKVNKIAGNAKESKDENLSKDINMSSLLNVDLPKKRRKKKSKAKELVPEKNERKDDETHKEGAPEENSNLIIEVVETTKGRNESWSLSNESNITGNISPTVTANLTKKRRKRKSKPTKLIHSQAMTTETTNGTSEHCVPEQVANLAENVIGTNGAISSCAGRMKEIIIDKKQNVRESNPKDLLDCHGHTERRTCCPDGFKIPPILQKEKETGITVGMDVKKIICDIMDNPVNAHVTTNSLMRLIEFSNIKIMRVLNVLQYSYNTFETENCVATFETMTDYLNILQRIDVFTNMLNVSRREKLVDIQKYYTVISKVLSANFYSSILSQCCCMIEFLGSQRNEEQSRILYPEVLRMIEAFGPIENIYERLKYRNDELYADFSQKFCSLPVTVTSMNNSKLLQSISNVQNSQTGHLNYVKLIISDEKIVKCFKNLPRLHKLEPKSDCIEFEGIQLDLKKIGALIDLKRNIHNFVSISTSLHRWIFDQIDLYFRILETLEEDEGKPNEFGSFVHKFLDGLDSIVTRHISKILVSQFYAFILSACWKLFWKIPKMVYDYEVWEYCEKLIILLRLRIPLLGELVHKLRFRNDRVYYKLLHDHLKYIDFKVYLLPSTDIIDRTLVLYKIHKNAYEVYSSFSPSINNYRLPKREENIYSRHTEKAVSSRTGKILIVFDSEVITEIRNSTKERKETFKNSSVKGGGQKIHFTIDTFNFKTLTFKRNTYYLQKTIKDVFLLVSLPNTSSSSLPINEYEYINCNNEVKIFKQYRKYFHLEFEFPGTQTEEYEFWKELLYYAKETSYSDILGQAYFKIFGTLGVHIDSNWKKRNILIDVSEQFENERNCNKFHSFTGIMLNLISVEMDKLIEYRHFTDICDLAIFFQEVLTSILKKVMELEEINHSFRSLMIDDETDIFCQCNEYCTCDFCRKKIEFRNLEFTLCREDQKFTLYEILDFLSRHKKMRYHFMSLKPEISELYLTKFLNCFNVVIFESHIPYGFLEYFQQFLAGVHLSEKNTDKMKLFLENRSDKNKQIAEGCSYEIYESISRRNVVHDGYHLSNSIFQNRKKSKDNSESSESFIHKAFKWSAIFLIIIYTPRIISFFKTKLY